jgi:hypothetical protein
MENEPAAERRAAGHRDAAHVRVRRVTGGVLAAAVALFGGMASYVAGASSHPRKSRRAELAVRPATAQRRPTRTVAVPEAPPAPPLLVAQAAPVPPPAPPPAPPLAPPEQAPAPVQAPPVAVSGGS